jgi:ATP-binding cassette subfamily B protein
MTTGISHSDFAIYRRLMRHARPCWPHIAGFFLLSLLSTPVALLTPLPLKIAVDVVIGGHSPPELVQFLFPTAGQHFDTAVLMFAVGLLIAITLLNHLQQLGSAFLRSYIGEKLIMAFRTQLFRHAQRVSLAYHNSRGTADSIYRIQWDAPNIQYATIDGVIPLVTAGCMLAGMIYVTARISWQLALVALAICPAFLVISQVSRRVLRREWSDLKSFESSAFSVVQEVLTALRVVKAFGQESREENRFVRRSSASMRARIRLSVAEGIFALAIGLTVALGSAVVLYLGVRQVQASTITLGEMLLVMGYLVHLYEPLKTVSNIIANMQSWLASAERAFALLDEPLDVTESPKARSLTCAKGAIAFRNVCFDYSKGHSVLQNISFEIDPGTRVGIVGMTGAGKSTLVSLLTRFYDPTKGQILLDGVDLREYKLADLRNQFAIVLQDPVLFSATILENIAYARSEASEQQIIEAAKAANAHDFVVRLPEGYNTPVGERGMTLSGGERQRIALARAFLKKAPILILDEPTSSVDTKTEAVIMEAMERLMAGRTTFLITHRFGMLANCDARLELDAGHISSVIRDRSTIGVDVA